MAVHGRPALRRRAAWALAAGVCAVVPVVSTAASAAADEAPPAVRPAPVVFVGAGGLTWDDVSRRRTPQLWDLVASSAVASMSVRTARPVTCPLDAWFTISQGMKGTSVQLDREGGLNPGQQGTSGPIVCEDIPSVVDGVVSGWQELIQTQEDSSGAYGRPGTLGDLLAQDDVCATAIGPGAAVALAQPDGSVPDYHPTWSETAQNACPVTVIDAGYLDPRGDERRGDLAAFDLRLGEILAAAPEGTHVIVAGTSDQEESPAALQVTVDHTVGLRQPRWLVSESTRHEGLVQVIDVTATLLALAGVDPEILESTQMDGTAWHPTTSPRGLTVAETVEDRRDFSIISQVIPDEGPVFGAWVAGVPLAILAVSAVALFARRRGAGWAQRSLFTDAAVGAMLVASSVWTALYVTTAVEWWRSDQPLLVLSIATALVMLAIALASAYARIHQVWRFVLVQSTLAFGALTIDGLTGTPLQVGSLLGAGPIYGGRFYGFGNVTFMVYASSALLLSAVVAEVFIRRGQRRRAVMATAAIGAIAVLVDGWPTFGADFGGMISLVPGVVLLVLLVAQVRLAAYRLVLVAATGAIAVALVSYLDYLRGPEDRSHMGGFVARLLDGEAGDVIANKLDALIGSLTSPLGWAEIVVFAVALAAVWNPTRMRVPELQLVFDEWPTLRQALLCLALTAGVGSLVNDSGALVAALAVLTTAPLLIATCAWWSTRTPHREPGRQPERVSA